MMKKIPRKYWFLIVIAPILIVLDQWTKMIVIEHFHHGESLPVISNFFNLTYVRNAGAAFGMMSQWSPAFRIPFFFVIPLIALTIMGMIFRTLPSDAIRVPVALALVVGGAVGNLIDRVRFQYVIDFLDFHWNYSVHFPAFNVADSAIFVGVVFMLFDAFQKEGEPHASRTS